MGAGVVGEVKQFCYLGDVSDCGAERAIRARDPAAAQHGASGGKYQAF